MVVVSVAISVAIAVAITVSVAAAATVGAVEYDGEAFEAFGVIDVLQLAKHLAVEQAGTYHKEGAVAILFKDLCVGNDVKRRAVDEDIFISLTHGCDEGCKAVAANELGGVGGQGAHRDDVQVVVLGVGYYDVVYIVCAAGEVVADTGGGSREVTRCCGAAQVAVDDKHLCALDGEAGGEVHG